MRHSDAVLTVPQNETAPARLGSELGAAIENAARAWLVAQPDASTLAANMPALQLVFVACAAHRDAGLWKQVQESVARLNGALAPDTVTLEQLAALLDFNLDVWQFTGADAYCEAAQRLTREAIARFDAERDMFHARASDAPNLLCVDANARIAQALYRAWRALDEAAARPIAGTVLGNVSDAFVMGEGLYQWVELPDGARSDAQHPAAYANAVQLFLTATETTGRGTYVSRASILADFLLAQPWADAAQLPFDGRAMLAEACAQLYSFTHADAYRDGAYRLLRETRDVPAGVNAATYALALKRYRGIVQ